jgi:GDP-L-fucose synthase
VSKKNKIFIAGHTGMVGSACSKLLKLNGYQNIITVDSSSLDLRDQNKVEKFIREKTPEVIINCAAKVGGIIANNNNPYSFLIDNMLIQNNLIKSSLESEVKKFIFLGSSCIYPRLSIQPIKEEYLLTSELEQTNQWYALAKISGVKLIESIRMEFNKDYVSLMPTNLYGAGDNYDLKNSHVLPALLKKFHLAKLRNQDNITLWGTGKPLREFLNVDDLADVILYFVENKSSDSMYNVGSGEELSIYELANMISKIVGFKGNIYWDDSKPDGTPRKFLDSSKIRSLGLAPKIKLEDGVRELYNNIKTSL